MSFRTSPTEAHLYSALHARLSTCPGLKTTIEHLDRQSYGHPDKNYEFLMSAARHMIENRRTARQTAEYSKIFRGTATMDPAMAAIGDNGVVRQRFAARQLQTTR